jgi:hypothetical protein
MEAKILILILVKVLPKDNKVINGILKTINGLKKLSSQTTMKILNKRKFANYWNKIHNLSKNFSEIIYTNNLGLILTTIKLY